MLRETIRMISELPIGFDHRDDPYSGPHISPFSPTQKIYTNFRMPYRIHHICGPFPRRNVDADADANVPNANVLTAKANAHTTAWNDRGVEDGRDR